MHQLFEFHDCQRDALLCSKVAISLRIGPCSNVDSDLVLIRLDSHISINMFTLISVKEFFAPSSLRDVGSWDRDCRDLGFLLDHAWWPTVIVVVFGVVGIVFRRFRLKDTASL